MEQELNNLKVRVDTLKYNTYSNLYSEISAMKKGLMQWRDEMTSMKMTWGSQMSEVSNMIQRIRELKTQSMNGTNDECQRQEINAEIIELLGEIGRIIYELFGSFNGGEWPCPPMK